MTSLYKGRDWSPWAACPLLCTNGKIHLRSRACTPPTSTESQSFCFAPDSHKQTCLLAVEGYQQAATNICFGGKDDTPAVFTFPLPTGCYKIKLQHLSGGIKCARSLAAYPFGCSYYNQDIFVSITGTEKTDVVMTKSSFTEQQGSGASVQYIATEECYAMATDKSYLIWYDEDLSDIYESDNSGESCISVYVVDYDC